VVIGLKTGIFGGSFNPVHSGHVKAALAAVRQLCLDRLLVIPVFMPPHKGADELVSSADRINMLKLAFEGYDEVEISDIEVKQRQKSYTIDTLEKLHGMYPEDEFYLLMGSDMFFTLPQWYRAEDIFKLAVTVAFCRSNDCNETKKIVEAVMKMKDKNGAFTEIVECSPFEVSSTEIREMVKMGDDTDGYVNTAVKNYIKENGLYL